MLENLKKIILDTLYPIHCLDCGKLDEWICLKCQSKIPIKENDLCPVCQKKQTPDGKKCLDCASITDLDALLVSSSYNNSIISKAVHLYKYNFVSDLGEILSNLIIKKYRQTNLPIPDLIIPMPLHPRRKRWRGYNQSDILAKKLSAKIVPDFEIDWSEKTLKRIKYNKPQMSIKNHKQRFENIENAFEVTDEKTVKSKTILIVDDVATTGASIYECAKTLKKSGAKKVFAIVIARQGNKY